MLTAMTTYRFWLGQGSESGRRQHEALRYSVVLGRSGGCAVAELVVNLGQVSASYRYRIFFTERHEN